MPLGIRGRVMLVAVVPALTIVLLLGFYFTQVRFADLEKSLRNSGLAMARQLIESLAGDFDPAEYANEYRGELRAMLEEMALAALGVKGA